MRRTILLLAAVLTLAMVLTGPATAAPNRGGLGPVYRLDCTLEEAGVWWAMPARGVVPGWDYNSTSPKPLALLKSAVFGEQPENDTDLTLCAVHGPVIPNTDDYDNSWGDEEEFWGFFRFF